MKHKIANIIDKLECAMGGAWGVADDAAEEIIAALPEMVNKLEWKQTANGQWFSGPYTIMQATPFNEIGAEYELHFCRCPIKYTGIIDGAVDVLKLKADLHWSELVLGAFGL